MRDNSEIIKTEIIRILNENGRIRGTDLVKRVTKKIGNEKIVYREISSLVESGEIEKRVHNKSHIEYELINLSESVNKQLRNLHKELEVSLEEMVKFNEEVRRSVDSHQVAKTVIYFIHVVQSIDSIMKLLSYYPAFKNDKMFSQINRKISDYWKYVMGIIMHHPEGEFLNYILENIRINQIISENVN